MVLLLLEQTGIRHASYALHGFTFSKVKISISWNKVECLKKKKKKKLLYQRSKFKDFKVKDESVLLKTTDRHSFLSKP